MKRVVNVCLENFSKGVVDPEQLTNTQFEPGSVFKICFFRKEAFRVVLRNVIFFIIAYLLFKISLGTRARFIETDIRGVVTLIVKFTAHTLQQLADITAV